MASVENIQITLKKPTITKEKIGKNKTYDSILKNVKYVLDETNLNVSNLHIIIKNIIEIIEATPVKGSEKKVFAIKILREIIDEKTFGEEEALLLMLVDNGSVGNIIDLIIDASKGKLNINTLINTGSGCLLQLLPFCFKKKGKNNLIKVK